MAGYRISVVRKKDQGSLLYTGSIELLATCWWDLIKPIPAGTYSGCSATRMATKANSRGEKREAIHLPNIPGFTGVFIHMGSDRSWSDGCIVIPESVLLPIWNDITPKDGRNVTVAVQDLPY